MEKKLQIAALTHQGMVRSNNEDAFTVSSDVSSCLWHSSADASALSVEQGEEIMLAVADGMGGANAGEIASSIAIQTFRETLSNPENRERLRQAPQIELTELLLKANRSIADHSHQNPSERGMGTTCVAAYVKQAQCFVAWVGDSRAYVFRAASERLEQISKDHSYVQELIDSDQLTPEEAFFHPDSNIITQSLGDAARELLPGYKETSLNPGDVLLLCSDGLNSMLQDFEIARLFLQGRSNMEDLAQELIDAANQAGGADNITVALCQSPQPPEAASPQPPMAEARRPKGAWRMHPRKTLLLLLLLLGVPLTYFFQKRAEHAKQARKEAFAARQAMFEKNNEAFNLYIDTLEMTLFGAIEADTARASSAPETAQDEIPITNLVGTEREMKVRIAAKIKNEENAEELVSALRKAGLYAWHECKRGRCNVFVGFNTREEAEAFKTEFSKKYPNIRDGYLGGREHDFEITKNARYQSF